MASSLSEWKQNNRKEKKREKSSNFPQHHTPLKTVLSLYYCEHMVLMLVMKSSQKTPGAKKINIALPETDRVSLFKQTSVDMHGTC